jgi:hypothetical protein
MLDSDKKNAEGRDHCTFSTQAMSTAADRAPRTAGTDVNLRTAALLRAEPMAAYLAISPRTLRRLAARRKVPCIRVSKRLVLFDPVDVLAALKKGVR